MIELWTERVWLQVKGMRTMFVIPLIGYFILIPAMTWILSIHSELSKQDVAASICYLIVPILSVWWTCTIQKEYIEGDGREILLLGRGVLYSVLVFWLLNVVCLLALFLMIDEKIRYNFSDLMMEMLLVTFIVNGLVYWLNFCMRSITMTLFVVVFYTIFSNYTFYNENLEKLLYYFQLQVLKDIRYEEGWTGYIRYILAGMVFWCMGMQQSKRLE